MSHGPSRRRPRQFGSANHHRRKQRPLLPGLPSYLGFSSPPHTTAGWSNFTLPYAKQDIASFLLVRGEFAWLGYGYQGCSSDRRSFPGNSWKSSGYEWPELLDRDYGVPLGACSETSPGDSQVFAREWSKASVSLDCNTFEASIEMKQAKHGGE